MSDFSVGDLVEMTMDHPHRIGDRGVVKELVPGVMFTKYLVTMNGTLCDSVLFGDEIRLVVSKSVRDDFASAVRDMAARGQTFTVPNVADQQPTDVSNHFKRNLDIADKLVDASSVVAVLDILEDYRLI